MKIPIDEHLSLELVKPQHAAELYALAEQNKTYIGEWMGWIHNMKDIGFINNFIYQSQLKYEQGLEYAFVIIEDERIVGRIGLYQIDLINQIGEIGYWVGEEYQGKGITTKACQALIDFGFDKVNLHRIQIRCATQNLKSNAIPIKLKFTHEGILRHAEKLPTGYVDLNIYSVLKA